MAATADESERLTNGTSATATTSVEMLAPRVYDKTRTQLSCRGGDAVLSTMLLGMTVPKVLSKFPAPGFCSSVPAAICRLC